MTVEHETGMEFHHQEHLAEVVQLSDHQHPHREGVFNMMGNLLGRSLDIGKAALAGTIDGIHDMIHGGFDEQFLTEFHEQRRPFTSEKGLKLTFRVLNPQFIGNGEHAAVYTYSLAVPGKHGCEIPAVEKIALHCRENQRPLIAVTSPGMAGPVSAKELRLLMDFDETPTAIMEGLRTILPDGTPLVALGASWGGMKTYKLAEIAPDEAKRTGHNLPVTHAIPVVSAGHKRLGPFDLIKAPRQWLIDEPCKAVGYVRNGDDPIAQTKRFFELLGTMPRHVSQYLAIGATTISIARAPLRNVRLQPETSYDDLAFDGDAVTSPQHHPKFIEASGHPDARSEVWPGCHLNLLDDGLDFMLDKLDAVPRVSAKVA